MIKIPTTTRIYDTPNTASAALIRDEMRMSKTIPGRQAGPVMINAILYSGHHQISISIVPESVAISLLARFLASWLDLLSDTFGNCRLFVAAAEGEGTNCVIAECARDKSYARGLQQTGVMLICKFCLHSDWSLGQNRPLRPCRGAYHLAAPGASTPLSSLMES